MHTPLIRHPGRLTQNDQVPFWVKLHGGKQLFGNWENRKKRKSIELSESSKKAKLGGFSGGGSQRISGEEAQKVLGIAHEEIYAIEDEDPYEDLEEGCDNMTQLRQGGCSGQDKYRISVEMVQQTFGFFGPFDEAPVSKHGKPDIILPGTHADLQNISPGEDGVFLQDEHFWYKGKEVHRKKGTKAGRLMWSLRSSGLPGHFFSNSQGIYF